MAKKLLSEAQMRRFAKLANLSPVNEMMSSYEEDMELRDALPAAEPEMDAEPELDAEPEMDAEMPAAMEDEEAMEMMEALKGISYVAEKKDIVEEVARRVAKRLLKAKNADQALKEALGSKK